MEEAILGERDFMLVAIEEAKKSVDENQSKAHPRVGAVAVRDGKIVGQAHRTSGDHAEFILLEQNLPDEQLSGSTIYTTLEPCTKRGSTKDGVQKIPCVDRLISRKPARVVIGILDPNPIVRGKGMGKLQDAGIKVDFFPDELHFQIREINRNFIREQELSDGAGLVGAKDMPSELHQLAESRAAVRAFLQRAEVRLSTMHRVAGAFLGGAGLLFLLPIIFRDQPREFMVTIMSIIANADGAIWIASVALIMTLPLAFIIPLYSLYLLVRDIVLFYFVGHSPGYSDDAFYPRFALSAIAFSPDEDLRVKEEILASQRQSDLMGFAMPRSAKSSGDLSRWDRIGASIYSPTRVLDANPTDLQKRFNLAVGQSGLLDRDLIPEAARMEVSLVRHNLHLRRLVFRYAKALIAMIWTMIMLLLVSTIFEVVRPPQFQIGAPLFMAALVVLVWLLLIKRVVHLPVAWVYESSNQNAPESVHNDPELIGFENIVGRFRWGAILPLVALCCVLWSWR